MAKKSATVLMIRFSALGDIMLHGTAVHFLSHLNREGMCCCRLIWVCKESFAPLLQKLFPQITVIPWRRDKNHSSELKKAFREADFLLDAQSNLRSLRLRLVFSLLYRKPVYRVPKDRVKRWVLLLRTALRSRQSPPSSWKLPQVWHVLLITLRKSLIKEGFLDGKSQQGSSTFPEAFPPRIDLPATFFKAVEEKLYARVSALRNHSGGYLSVTVGAAHATKQAPIAFLASILNTLAKKLPSAPVLVLLGGTLERDRAQRLKEALRWPGEVVDLCGQTSLEEVAWVLSKSRRVLAHDTGIFHMAEALGVGVAVLFGPTWQQGGFAPHLSESQSFYSLLGCRPCSRHGKRPCRFKDQLCFKLISTLDVAAYLARGWSPPQDVTWGGEG